MKASIAEAIHALEDFLTILESAYWESSSIERKDTLFDLTSIFNIELRELAKLSIEDHYLSYEAVSTGARNVQPTLRLLHSQIDQWVLRSNTTEQLRHQLSDMLMLLKPEQ